MKRLLIIGFALFISSLFVFSSTKQPVSEIIYQNWIMIGESPTHIDVSARVIRCHPDSAAQAHIMLFNEGVGTQTAHFNLRITNPSNNEHMDREITYAMALGDMFTPLCENNNYPYLRINLPANWDPAAVTFTITFIP